MNETIQYIINSKAIAVVGVSDKKFGGTIYKTLKKRGNKVYPVHPTKVTFDNDTCYASLDQLPSDVETAVFAVSPSIAEKIIDDAINSSIKHIWFQQGKNFKSAELKAQAQGFQTVSGKCILMYAEPVDGIHSVHRFFSNLVGNY